MSDAALWRRLDTPGHDAARLVRTDLGWSLRGTAVFRHEAGPACIGYALHLDLSWRTMRGEVRGFLAGRSVSHAITRGPEGWRLDGMPVAGLDRLLDLDYGFTPATNLPQIRRLGLAPGQAADLPVAWFDLGSATLTELPQRYERRDETTYRYAAPTVPYEGLLVLSRSGFVRSYPLLWEMEP
jgi:uncharacterized protein